MGQDWAPINTHDPEVIADVLLRQPLVQMVFSDVPGAARVPFMDSPRIGLGTIAGSLDRIAYNLLFVTKMNRNLLTRDQAIAAAPELDPYWLDRAAADLVVTGLAAFTADRELTLFDDIASRIGLPLPCFSDYVDLITSDSLRRAAQHLGLGDIGTRKDDRADALLEFLSDAASVRGALDQLSDNARTVFQLLWERTIDGAPSDRQVPGAHATYDFLPQEINMLRYGRGANSPVIELSQSLLIGSDFNGFEVWLWAETAAALGLRLVSDWVVPNMPDVVALDPTGPDAIADVLHALDEVIAATTAAPALGNKSGARRPPVKYWRSVAKAAGLDAELTIRCGNLAIELGLLVPELGPAAGRGRNAKRDCFWVPEPTRLGEFGARTATRQWAALVDRWLTPQLDPDIAATQQRIMLLSALTPIPEGFGIPAAGLSKYLLLRHTWFSQIGDTLDDHLADLVRLGVLTTGSAIGLTPAGRAFCHDLDALDRLYPGDSSSSGSSGTATVQADHTVITPADASIDTIIGLRRVADPVSSGAVAVWRLSADRIARAAAANTTVEGFDPVEFVRSLSSTGLPPAVDRFLTDAAHAASTIAIKTVGCVITSSDHAALADAARHKTAKLEVVAPGVAVSSLTEARVSEVLRSKGVVLSGERVAGAEATKPASAWEVNHVGPDEVLPALTAVFLGSPHALAEQMSHG